MKSLVVIVEEDEGKLYFEDQQLDTCSHPYMMCIVTAVTGISDISEDDFPDHVKEMHQDRDQKFEVEYKVSTIS